MFFFFHHCQDGAITKALPNSLVKTVESGRDVGTRVGRHLGVVKRYGWFMRCSWLSAMSMLDFNVEKNFRVPAM